MGEIRIVGPGKPHGYPYPVCKKYLSKHLSQRFHGLPLQSLEIVSKLRCKC